MQHVMFDIIAAVQSIASILNVATILKKIGNIMLLDIFCL